MTRQALVGVFTIVALCALFAIFFVLANVGTQGRYKIGVHFKTAAGLHKGALVYESGVVVGIVDSTALLEDFTVDVILAINNSVSVPRNARFIIQAPLTGDSSLEIVPAAAAPLPPGSVGADASARRRRGPSAPSASHRAAAAGHESGEHPGSARSGPGRSAPARLDARRAGTPRAGPAEHAASRR